MKLTKHILLRLINEAMEQFVPKDLRDHLRKIQIDTSNMTDEDWEDIAGYLDGLETIEDIRTFDHLLTMQYGWPEGVIEDYYSATGADRGEGDIDVAQSGWTLGKWEDEEELSQTTSWKAVWDHLHKLTHDKRVIEAQNKYRIKAWQQKGLDTKYRPGSTTEQMFVVYATEENRVKQSMGAELVLSASPGKVPMLRFKPSDWFEMWGDDGEEDNEYLAYKPIPEFEQWLKDQSWQIGQDFEKDVQTLITAMEILSKIDPLVGARRQRKFLKNPEKFLKSDLRRGVLRTIGFE